MIGSAVLALVGAIMEGFQAATQAQLQSVHPTIMIRSADATINYEKIKEVLSREFPQVSASSPMLERFAMVKDVDGQNVVQFVGIDPETEPHVTSLERMIMGKNKNFTSLLTGNNIIIGFKLAQQIGLVVGDSFELMYMQDSNEHFGQVRVRVNGFLKTGIDEFDSSCVFANYTFVHDLFPDLGASQIGLKLIAGADEKALLQRLRARIPLEVVPWQELYLPLLAALTLEKYAMLFVMMLICMVASMNIISLIFMLITHKRAIIALLRACGFALRGIKILFMSIGVFIGVFATSVGLALAFLMGLFLRACPMIKLPDVYYTNHLPITFNPVLFLGIFVVALLLCIIATLVPLRKISSMSVADVLRFEG